MNVVSIHFSLQQVTHSLQGTFWEASNNAMLVNRWASGCTLSPQLPAVALQRPIEHREHLGLPKLGALLLSVSLLVWLWTPQCIFVWAQRGTGGRTAVCPSEWVCQHLDQIIDQLSLVVVRAVWFALLRNYGPLREASEWHKFSCEVREICFEDAIEVNLTVPKTRKNTCLFWSSSLKWWSSV